jgi:ABC-2 type transport system ATP-binding protein
MTGAPDPAMTGEENVCLMADLEHLCRDAGRARVAVLPERFDLVDAAGGRRPPNRQGDT